MAEEKICFMIAPIGEPESETRKRSDQILKHIVSPAAKECGYNALRADQISEPGIITSQVIQHVVDDHLVLADLTDRNPNVFYELAVRHAIRKPLIQIIRKGEAIPFDVAGTRTIHVDHHDLDSVEEAATQIVKQIRAVEKDATQVDTPISVALDLQMLRQSENPEQRSLADVVGALSELRTAFLAMEKRLCDPRTLVLPESSEYLFRRNIRNSVAHGRDSYAEMAFIIQKLDDIASEKIVSAAERDTMRGLTERLGKMVHRMMIDAG